MKMTDTWLTDSFWMYSLHKAHVWTCVIAIYLLFAITVLNGIDHMKQTMVLLGFSKSQVHFSVHQGSGVPVNGPNCNAGVAIVYW